LLRTEIQTTKESRLRQGDILRDVFWLERVSEISGVIEVSRIIFPLAIVLTQDCDLEQDHRFRREAKATQDKWLMSVLMAPVYNVEHVYLGEHLSELDIKMEFADDVPAPPSVIDFKHYFSAAITYLTEHKPTAFVCSVAPLFREDIAQRFASYLARVGLPELGAPAIAAGPGK
jgi:hypothetical protein